METLATTTVKPALVTVNGVEQVYRKGGGGEVPVLQGISLSLQPNEIVGLLGRSGCGKSTLLRIIAGLMSPTAGTVTIAGEPVTGPAPQVALVFQTFALFPWLTVLENVELGLEAQGLAPEARHKRALAAIDLIGLDGYESAYPKELSGGMRQRVGLARALVVHPKVLLMDEPFSALDVLTAETLRTDLLDLWSEGRMPISAILMVTHNIEEAVLMCDRIVLLASNPGRIAAEIKVELPQPRNRLEPKFRQLVDDIYARMTERTAGKPARDGVFPGTGIAMVLPRVSPNELAGLMEAVAAAPYNGHADLPALAAGLQMEVDDLFPVADVLEFPALRRGRGRRHQPDRCRQALRCRPISTSAKGCSPSTCSPSCRSRPTSNACSTSAPRIAPTPAGSATNLRTICPRRMPSRRCGRWFLLRDTARRLRMTRVAIC